MRQVSFVCCPKVYDTTGSSGFAYSNVILTQRYFSVFQQATNVYSQTPARDENLETPGGLQASKSLNCNLKFPVLADLQKCYYW